jgi:enamine deaminase RidA (YjgF/YER057c/UK114 family)
MPLHITSAEAAPVAVLHRGSSDNMHVVEIQGPGLSEFDVTVAPQPGEHFSRTIERLAKVLQGIDATVVRLIIFGSAKVRSAVLEILHQELRDPGLPVTWLEGEACDGADLAGVQVHAVRGGKIRTQPGGGQALARIWDDGLARHCVCNNVLSTQGFVSPAEQAREVFHRLQTSLADAGMELKDIARTWFYLNGILSWYDGFNRVRNEVFTESGIPAGGAPASTGIGAWNPAGRAVAALAWAVQPHDGKPVVEHLASPRQGPAAKYGSNFSRAVEVRGNGFRRLLVSGTASIAPDGRTEHIGDVQAQIGLSMQVVQAILASREMTLADVSRATAYLRSAEDAPLFTDWLAQRGLREFPAVSTRCDICRDDLLFEIELDAVLLEQ